MKKSFSLSLCLYARSLAASSLLPPSPTPPSASPKKPPSTLLLLFNGCKRAICLASFTCRIRCRWCFCDRRVLLRGGSLPVSDSKPCKILASLKSTMVLGLFSEALLMKRTLLGGKGALRCAK